MKRPTRKQVEAAKAEIVTENEERTRQESTPEREAIVAENSRRSELPSEHPDHIHGMMCDGQDGWNSYCVRLRDKLFGGKR